MLKQREEFDSEEEFLRDRLRVLREQKNRLLDEVSELKPYAAYGERALARDEAEMWERIRTEFPERKHWAANLAAHNWTIKLVGDRLYALGRDRQLVSVADADPEQATEFPAVCKICQHYKRVDFQRGRGRCSHHKHQVFDQDACEDYVRGQ
jgi:hypothetical protein